MRLLIYILSLLVTSAVCFGQTDSNNHRKQQAVEIRAFDAKVLQEMKDDPELQYDKMREPKQSLWDRFWMWFWWQVDQLFKTKKGRTTAWSVLIIFGLAAIGFAIYKIRQMNRTGLFMAGGGGGLPFSVGRENIHEIDFEAAIQEAIAQNDYRLAVRLLYLKTLKMMADKGVIDWRVNKTNHDYIAEVKGNGWQPLFSRLTYQFEYAWYGEAQVPHEKFDLLQQEFSQLHNQVA